MKSTKNVPPPATPFTQGTAYYPDHWPEAEWDRDLGRIADAGVSFVRFGEFSWSWFEPAEGKWEWGGYDRFVELAARRGLKLILCTPTATLPPWLLMKHPDCRLVNDVGQPCFSHRHHWCWRHAPSQALARKVIEALAKRYGAHQAVVGWQIDNEPNMGEDTRQVYDFHPATLAVFRTWLKDKYGMLDALNAAWYSNFWSQRYSDWEQIGLTHMPHRANPSYWLDFVRFREWNMAEMVRWQAGLLRRHIKDQTVGTNIPEVGGMTVPIAIDPFDQARGLDWVGTDVYHASGHREADVAHTSYSTDLMRCAAAAGGATDFFIAETQGGPHRRTWHSTFAAEAFEPGYLQALAEAHVTRGASKVFWFLWRPTPGGAEMGMNGVQDQDGGGTPRTEVVKELSAAGRKFAKLRAAHAKRPRAVLHYARDTMRLLAHWRQHEAAEHALRGAHRLLEAAGYRVDFVDDAGLEAFDADADVPLVLPRSDVMSAAQLAALARHVEKGGAVLIGMHGGKIDERGQLYPHPPLAALVGAEQRELVDVGPQAVTKMGTADVKGYRRLWVTDGKIAQKFTNGWPAAVRKGTATIVGWDVFAWAREANDMEAALRTLKI